MKFCKRCVEPETNPGLVIDDEGVCNVCRYYESKPDVDWSNRLVELKKIAEWAKENNKGSYDAVIGVSGGKDSTKQALFARDVLGLNCLLVTNPPDVITEVGQQNIDNLVEKGFDIIKYYANPVVYKKMVIRALCEYGNPQKPSEYTIASIPLRMAINMNIPLLIHGENSALEMGEPEEFTSSNDFEGSALGFANSNTVRGGQALDWVDDEISLNDILPYQYPSNKEINDSGVKAIYLGYFLKEFNTFENAKFAIANGLSFRNEKLHDLGRYHRYSALDANMNVINGMIKYVKFGYGSATDKASLDIRAGKLTRDEGIALVKEYDGLCADRFVKEYCEFLGVTEDFFWTEVEKYRGTMWSKDVNGKWTHDSPIWELENYDKSIDVVKVINRLNKELGIAEENGK